MARATRATSYRPAIGYNHSHVDQPAIVVLISVLLVLASVFFVASEYALVGSRQSKLAADARRGNKRAKRALEALQDVSRMVAGSQIAITMIGIGLGSVTEPFLSAQFRTLLGTSVPTAVAVMISYLVITYVIVVVGELVPKYVALRAPEKIAHFTVGPLAIFSRIVSPLVWLVRASAALLLRPFGIDVESSAQVMEKDELLLMVRAGGSLGTLDKGHAEMVSRALKLDGLTARDVMIHRLDINWLDVNTPRSELHERLNALPHSRIPVCNGDIDELVGIAYLHDLVKLLSRPESEGVETVIRPVIAVPENLGLDRIVGRMRDDRTQIVIVMDEYGGTSGLITLEDVVEELFGELEDSLESERPPIEIYDSGRVVARGSVRFDELVSKLGIELDHEPVTDTLAEMVVDQLGRIPQVGDHVETPAGTIRVDNMARRRITRVSLIRP